MENCFYHPTERTIVGICSNCDGLLYEDNAGETYCEACEQ
jgi:hypothetical protein